MLTCLSIYYWKNYIIHTDVFRSDLKKLCFFLTTGPDSYKSVTLIHSYPFDSAACVSLLEKSSKHVVKTVPHRRQRQSIRPSFGKRKKITTPQTVAAAVISALLAAIRLAFCQIRQIKTLRNLTTPLLDSTTSSSPQPRETLNELHSSKVIVTSVRLVPKHCGQKRCLRFVLRYIYFF